MLIIWHQVLLQRQILVCFKDFFRNPDHSAPAHLLRSSKLLPGAIWRFVVREEPNIQPPWESGHGHEVVSYR